MKDKGNFDNIESQSTSGKAFIFVIFWAVIAGNNAQFSVIKGYIVSIWEMRNFIKDTD